MSNYKTRLKVEYLQLRSKYKDLCKFIDEPADISEDHLELLKKQEKIMKSYLKILKSRCELLGIDTEEV